MGTNDTKKQQDTKPRAVTVHGIQVTIDPAALDDWDTMELLEALQDDPDGNALKVVPLTRRILGKDYGRVKETLRGPDGHLKAEAMASFLTDLFAKLNPNS